MSPLYRLRDLFLPSILSPSLLKWFFSRQKSCFRKKWIISIVLTYIWSLHCPGTRRYIHSRIYLAKQPKMQPPSFICLCTVSVGIFFLEAIKIGLLAQNQSSEWKKTILIFPAGLRCVFARFRIFFLLLLVHRGSLGFSLWWRHWWNFRFDC